MNLLQKLEHITTLILDIDGVLTDGKLYMSPQGEISRTFSVKDGYALQIAARTGYDIWICSGGYTGGMEGRFEKFGISEVHMKVEDKGAVVAKLMKDHQKEQKEVLYIGDDVPDLAGMQLCGVNCCPADAMAEVKQFCDYVSPIKGGEGVVRDVFEKVLKIREDWPKHV